MVNKVKQILKKDKVREIVAYLIIGVLTTIVNLVVYYVCTNYILDADRIINIEIANVIAWIIAVLFAYFTNRIIVFKSKDKQILKEGIKFCSGRVITLLLEIIVMFLMISVLHISDKIAKIVTQVLIIVGNYIISKLFVFKSKE